MIIKNLDWVNRLASFWEP